MLLPLSRGHLYYDLVGPGNGPVVCFSHALAADSGMWAEQVPALLNAGFRVLRIDMRGHGGSAPVQGTYNMDDLAGDVIAVVDALKIRQFHFIGLSIGGMFGQTLGLKHAERLKSLMLCNTSPSSPPDSKERWGPRVVAVKQENSLRPVAEATMGRWVTDGFRAKRASRWQQIYDTVIGTTPQGYIGCATAIQNFDYTRELKSIMTPTMLLFGVDDANVVSGAARQIAGLLPNGRYEEIGEGARHLPNVEFPEVFNGLMLNWLKA